MTQPDTNEPNAPRFAIPLWVWCATLAALVFFAWSLWQAQKLQRQLTELQLQMRLERGRKGSLEAQLKEMEQIRALLAAPDTHVLLMKPVSAEVPPVKIFWNEGIGLLITAQDVPTIPAGRVLQIWIVPKAGIPISAGVFQPEANRVVMRLLRPAAAIRMKGADALTITVEPAGGSSQPTSEPQWVGRIP